MNFEKDLAAHAKKELEKELRKFTCKVHNKHPKIKTSNLGGSVVDCCCDEFEAIVKAHFGD